MCEKIMLCGCILSIKLITYGRFRRTSSFFAGNAEKSTAGGEGQLLKARMLVGKTQAVKKF